HQDYIRTGTKDNNLIKITTYWYENKLSANRKTLKLIIKNSKENFLKLIKSIPYTNQNLTSYLIGYITYCFLENGLKKYIDHFVNYTSSNRNNIKTAIDTLLMH